MSSPDDVLRRLLGSAVVLPLVLLCVLAGLLIVEARAFVDLAGWVGHTERVLGAAETTSRLLIDRQDALRGYLLSGGSTFLADYVTADSALGQSFSSLRALVNDNPAQQDRLERARESSDAWDRAAQAVAERRKAAATWSYSAAEADRVRGLLVPARTEMQAFADEERRLLGERTARATRWTRNGMIASVVAALACGIALGIIARRQVQRVADAYRQLLALRDELLNATAHELRTPVTSLLLQLQYLERHGPAEGSVEVARRQARRLEALIEALIDANALSSGAPIALERDEVDLRDVVRTAAEKSGAGAAVELQLGRDPVRGRWDRKHLEAALTALIANAHKFGEGQPVTIEVRQVGSMAEVAVVDRGKGVPPHLRATIFEKHIRGVDPRSFGGLGLGLFTARRVAELHGGTVGFDSTPHGGSRFTVRLPA